MKYDITSEENVLAMLAMLQADVMSARILAYFSLRCLVQISADPGKMVELLSEEIDMMAESSQFQIEHEKLRSAAIELTKKQTHDLMAEIYRTLSLGDGSQNKPSTM